MASKRNIWTGPHREGGWANRSEGASQPMARYATKAETEAVGREAARARGVEHIIQRRDGRIAERNSYGNDPHPPRG